MGAHGNNVKTYRIDCNTIWFYIVRALSSNFHEIVSEYLVKLFLKSWLCLSVRSNLVGHLSSRDGEDPGQFKRGQLGRESVAEKAGMSVKNTMRTAGKGECGREG